MASFVPDFSEYTKYNKNYPFTGVIFPANAPLSGADLNEAQEIIALRQQLALGTLMSDGYVHNYAAQKDPLIENVNPDVSAFLQLDGVVVIDGNAYYINGDVGTMSSLISGDGNYLGLVMEDTEVTSGSGELYAGILKAEEPYGEGELKEPLDNYLADNAFSTEISRRKSVSFRLERYEDKDDAGHILLASLVDGLWTWTPVVAELKMSNVSDGVFKAKGEESGLVTVEKLEASVPTGVSTDTVGVTVTQGSTQTYSNRAQGGGAIRIEVGNLDAKHVIKLAEAVDYLDIQIYGADDTIPIGYEDGSSCTDITMDLAKYPGAAKYDLVTPYPVVATVTRVPSVYAEVKDGSIGMNLLDGAVQSVLTAGVRVETYEIDERSECVVIPDKNDAEHVVYCDCQGFQGGQIEIRDSNNVAIRQQNLEKTNVINIIDLFANNGHNYTISPSSLSPSFTGTVTVTAVPRTVPPDRSVNRDMLDARVRSVIDSSIYYTQSLHLSSNVPSFINADGCIKYWIFLFERSGAHRSLKASDKLGDEISVGLISKADEYLYTSRESFPNIYGSLYLTSDFDEDVTIIAIKGINTHEGGFAAGTGAQTHYEYDADGEATSLGWGAAVGQSAAVYGKGGAVGMSAVSRRGGGAVGVNAVVEEPLAGLPNGGGGAVGGWARTHDGGAVGAHANSTSGGAIGKLARASTGAAVGDNAKTSGGVAVGDNAKTVESNGYTAIDAVQLGTGTNSTPKTMQVYDHKLLDANGNIPRERLGALYSYGTQDLTAGSSNLETGKLYFVYEE